MTIDEEILLNRLAQGISNTHEGLAWFETATLDKKREILRWTNAMIAQGGVVSEDVSHAIERSGLKASYTPCVLLTKGDIRVQLAKVANLQESELIKAFRLVVSLLGVADERRRVSRPLDPDRHWWHRDLRDPDVLEGIRREFKY